MTETGRAMAHALLACVFSLGGVCESGEASHAARSLPTRHPDGTGGQVTPTGHMTVARASHTATLLPNGNVLVAGGMGERGATSELYDPTRGVFRPGATLLAERAGHTASLLADGRVLLVGGWAGDVITAGTELYDPVTNRSTAGSAMSTRRSGHTATTLADGRILIAGGFDGTNRLASAELYDPRRGTFTLAGSLRVPRGEHAAALLRDGRVLITGGNRGRGDVLASAELFDPITGVFTPTGSMTVVRHKHAATSLADGGVLIAGGSDARDGRGQYASAELYDPASGSFAPVANMSAVRFKIPRAVVLLGSGEVLVAGGDERVELYHPGEKVFHVVPGKVDDDLAFSTATVLAGGDVLIAGGYDRSITPTVRAWVFHERTKEREPKR
jgi:hypothetical protein